MSLGKHGLWDKYPRPIRSQAKFLYLSTKIVLISKSKQNSAIFWHWHEWHFTCVLPDKGTLVLKRYQAVLKQIFCPLLILRKCCWKYLTLTITFWWLNHNNNNTIHDTFICLDRWDEKLVLLTPGCSPRSRQFSHEKYKHRRRLTQVIIARLQETRSMIKVDIDN